MVNPDLNAVRTFVTVYETRSVTAAARVLHLTQPTVTHTLNKLRRQLDDDLFVRSRTGVTPTAAATRAYPRFVAALNSIDGVFQRATPFDPATTDVTFRIGMSDAGEVSVLPPVVAAVTALAPSARLEVTSLDIDVVENQLVHGELDGFVSSAEFHSHLISRERLFQEHYVVLVSLDHPRVRGGMTADELDAEPHIAVEGVTGHHVPARFQRDRGVTVRVRVPRFTAVPYLVAQSDAVAIVPGYIADLFTAGHAVRAVPLPWPIPPIEVCVHARHPHSRSPEQDWLITTIRQALEPASPIRTRSGSPD